MFKFKQSGRISLFDKEKTSSKLSKLGNPLEKLHKVIDFEMFRMVLEDNLLNHDKKNNAGCKSYDLVMTMEKVKLTEMRKAKGISQREIAKMMCMDALNYTCREKGQARITLQEWKKLADILEIPIEFIGLPV
jgi:DNA-binding XRE family transcriptional regulator